MFRALTERVKTLTAPRGAFHLQCYAEPVDKSKNDGQDIWINFAGLPVNFDDLTIEQTSMIEKVNHDLPGKLVFLAVNLSTVYARTHEKGYINQYLLRQEFGDWIKKCENIKSRGWRVL